MAQIIPARRRSDTTLKSAGFPIQRAAADQTLFDTFRQRESDELVLGILGPVGSGVTFTSQLIKDILEQEYSYEVEIIKVSDLIKEAAKIVKSLPDGARRFETLQKSGTDLRKDFGPSYLMELCVQKVGLSRKYDPIPEGQMNAVSQRKAHIIDSIKHPSEIEFMRAVYREHFWAVAVLANEGMRRKRLKQRGISNGDEANKIISRDADELLGYGQKVRDAVHRADYFLHNNTTEPDDLRAKASRLLSRIFNTDVAALSADETGMAHAYSAASRSACLSRQVGAAILAESGEILGVGWNDVPKFGGGLYGEVAPGDPMESDHRCVRLTGSLCHNDQKKDDLYESIIGALKENNLLNDKATSQKIKAALVKTEVRNITEFSRSIHAEMEAMLSAGRSGRAVVGAKLYTTTYPCHNCARHIVAAGIKEIVYIEPYPKSLALVLHKDAITEDSAEEGKVLFRQYEGVAPRSANRIYPAGEERKQNGRWKKQSPNSAKPLFRPSLDSFIDREQLVIAKLSEQEEGNDEKV